jgi:hypothetical protein
LGLLFGVIYQLVYLLPCRPKKKKRRGEKKEEKKSLALESARGPSGVLAHKVRRKLTTNAFEGTVSLLLRRDPDSISVAGRKREAR